MSTRASIYLVLFLFSLLNATSVNACSDMLFTEKYGTIELRYTSFCPKYHDTEKLKELSGFLNSIRSETEVDVLVLINTIPIQDSNDQFISLAIDTLRGFDRNLAQDFNSFYKYQKLWRESELNSKKVPYLENIKYPMNISISKEDSVSKTGIKLIYNYQWDEPHNSDNSQYHMERISNILKWAVTHTHTIRETQTEQIVDSEYNNWKLSVLTIPNSKIQQLTSIKSKREKFFLWIAIPILTMIALTSLIIKKGSS